MRYLFFALFLSYRVFAITVIHLDPTTDCEKITAAILAQIPMKDRFLVESDQRVLVSGDFELWLGPTSTYWFSQGVLSEVEAALRGEVDDGPRLDVTRASYRILDHRGERSIEDSERSKLVLAHAMGAASADEQPTLRDTSMPLTGLRRYVGSRRTATSGP